MNKVDGYHPAVSMIRIGVLLLAASACAAPVKEMPAPGQSEPLKKIYLVSHGWHAGIVLRRTDVPDVLWPELGGLPETRHLEVGWGDMDYYRTVDPHIGHIFKAGLWPTASILHIVAFDANVPAYFLYSEIIEIELSATGLERLSRAIAESFAVDEAGNATSLGPGLYGNSRFYRSREKYHLFNTCNVWTSRVLRTAGLPITPMRTITVESLMSRARELGRVVQSRPESSESR